MNVYAEAAANGWGAWYLAEQYARDYERERTIDMWLGPTPFD